MNELELKLLVLKIKEKFNNVYYFRHSWNDRLDELLKNEGFLVERFMQRESCFCNDNEMTVCKCLLTNLKLHESYKISLSLA